MGNYQYKQYFCNYSEYKEKLVDLEKLSDIIEQEENYKTFDVVKFDKYCGLKNIFSKNKLYDKKLSKEKIYVRPLLNKKYKKNHAFNNNISSFSKSTRKKIKEIVYTRDNIFSKIKNNKCLLKYINSNLHLNSTKTDKSNSSKNFNSYNQRSIKSYYNIDSYNLVKRMDYKINGKQNFNKNYRFSLSDCSIDYSYNQKSTKLFEKLIKNNNKVVKNLLNISINSSNILKTAIKTYKNNNINNTAKSNRLVKDKSSYKYSNKKLVCDNRSRSTYTKINEIKLNIISNNLDIFSSNKNILKNSKKYYEKYVENTDISVDNNKDHNYSIETFSPLKVCKTFKYTNNNTIELSCEKEIEISEKDEFLLRNIVNNMFPKLTFNETNYFLQNFFYQKFEKDTVLIEGLDTVFFFVIKSGSVGLFKNSILKNTFKSGQCFGSINIINKNSEILYNKESNKFNSSKSLNTPINLIFQCLSDCEIYLISSEQIERLKRDLLEKKHIQYLKIINSSSVFKHLDNSDKLALIDEMKIHKINRNAILQKKNECINNLYYVLDGTILFQKDLIYENKIESSIILDNLEEAKIKLKNKAEEYNSCICDKYSFINEDILYYKNDILSKHNIISSNCKVALISINDLRRIFGVDYIDYFTFKIFSSVHSNSKFLKNLVKEMYLMDSIVDIQSLNSSKISNNQNINKLIFEQNEIFHYNEFEFNDVAQNGKYSNIGYNKHDYCLKKIYLNFKKSIYKKGEYILNKKVNNIVLIIKGIAINNNSGILIYDSNFIERNFTSYDEYICYTDECIVLESSVSNLLSLNIKFNNKSLLLKMKYFNSCRWLINISNESVYNLSQYIKEYNIKSGKILIRCGEIPTSIICILSGYIIKSKSKNISNLIENLNYSNTNISNVLDFKNNNISLFNNIEILNKYSIIGEQELFSNKPSEYSYVALNSNVKIDSIKVLYIYNEAIKEVLGENIINYLKSIYNCNYTRIINLDKIFLLSYLGQGAFGCVNLVKYPINDNLNMYQTLAIKCLSKNYLRSKLYLYKYLIEEKKCISMCNSPFICKLISTTTDNNFCYIITEFIDGINLSKLDYYNLLNYCSYDCLFYFINILIIIEYLKKKSIMHRDIKMSNIMIDKSGYLKLIDFGLAKNTKDFSYTIIGTPYYMAPEVILGRGYTQHCDYWSAGVILYKLYYSVYPFGNDCLSSMEIYNSIINKDLDIPHNKNSYSYSKINNIIKDINSSNSNFIIKRTSDINLNNLVTNFDINKCLKLFLEKNPRNRISKLKDLNSYLNLSDNQLEISKIQDMKYEVPYTTKLILSIKDIYNKDDYYKLKSTEYKKNNNHLYNNEINKLNNKKYNNYTSSNYYNLLEGILYNEESFFKYLNYNMNNSKSYLNSSSIINNEKNWLKLFESID